MGRVSSEGPPTKLQTSVSVCGGATNKVAGIGDGMKGPLLYTEEVWVGE